MPSGETVRTGLLLILAVMWEGRNEDAKTMRLPKAMALRFISDYGIGRGKNPVTVLCESLGCTLIMPGSNKGGNVTNIWNYPIGTTGTTEITVQLKPSLIGRWNRRGAIMKERQEKAEPATATIRATLKRVTESARFKEVAQNLTAKGEIQAVASWRKNPGKLTRTIDGDLLTGVNRLTKELRQSLLIGGREVIEIDLKSAHVAILPMLLVGDNSAAWIAETARFQAEYSTGFKRFYGERKEWKHDFLATFNQSVNAARHSCPQYREFERSFPILAKRMNWIRAERPKALGTRLRSTLAKVMIPEIKADVLLITDGLLLPKTADVAGIIARLEQAISQVSGIKPIIETESA